MSFNNMKGIYIFHVLISISALQLLFLDIPKLPPTNLKEEKVEEKEEMPEDMSEKPSKKRKTSGPKVANPYDLEDTSFIYPILVAIGIFLPTLLCLCKL